MEQEYIMNTQTTQISQEQEYHTRSNTSNARSVSVAQKQNWTTDAIALCLFAIAAFVVFMLLPAPTDFAWAWVIGGLFIIAIITVLIAIHNVTMPSVSQLVRKKTSNTAKVTAFFEPIETLTITSTPAKTFSKKISRILGKITEKRTTAKRAAKSAAQSAKVARIAKNVQHAKVMKVAVAKVAKNDLFGDVHPVIDVEGIGPEYAQRLNGIGIKNTKQLWQAEAERVAKSIDVSPETVQSWQRMAELISVKDIGPQYAELLERSGVHSIAQLKSLSAKKLLAMIKKKQSSLKINIQGNSLGKATVSHWISEAKAHKATISS